ncbi:MAG: alpha/beta hydrolase [Massilia sp.]
MPVQPHLHARPARVTEPAPVGLHTLPIGGSRESYMYVPPDSAPTMPMPLVLLLHGAGGSAHDGLRIFLHQADQDGLILVAPASKASSWDIIVKGVYGADVDLADRALAHAFAHYAIDPRKVAVGGFSDGASYALTLGLANGDLFTHVIAFSPGFIAPVEARDSPRVFISHGTRDTVLPIDACSRRLAPVLRSAEYPLIYHEFEGGHEIPSDEARFAIDWFALDEPDASKHLSEPGAMARPEEDQADAAPIGTNTTPGANDSAAAAPPA